jgi:hypothetical protein
MPQRVDRRLHIADYVVVNVPRGARSSDPRKGATVSGRDRTPRETVYGRFVRLSRALEANLGIKWEQLFPLFFRDRKHQVGSRPNGRPRETLWFTPGRLKILGATGDAARGLDNQRDGIYPSPMINAGSLLGSAENGRMDRPTAIRRQSCGRLAR